MKSPIENNNNQPNFKEFNAIIDSAKEKTLKSYDVRTNIAKLEFICSINEISQSDKELVLEVIKNISEYVINIPVANS